MMPGTDGIEVCRQVRDKKATPIIMLTAKGEEANRVQGFEVGTDDYIVKPFSPREVVLRVKALLRRSSQTSYLNTDTTAKNVLVFSHLSTGILQCRRFLASSNRAGLNRIRCPGLYRWLRRHSRLPRSYNFPFPGTFLKVV